MRALRALTIMVATDAPADHQHAFQVTATYNGGTPAGCQAASDLPKATGMAKHQLVTGGTTSASDMPGMNGAQHAQMTGQTATTATPTPPASAKKTPGAPLVLTITLVAALAIALRRRT